jgi:hypothetical protein
MTDWRIAETIVYGDLARVHLGSHVLNNALLNVESGDIAIEDDVFFGTMYRT